MHSRMVAPTMTVATMAEMYPLSNNSELIIAFLVVVEVVVVVASSEYDHSMLHILLQIQDTHPFV